MLNKMNFEFDIGDQATLREIDDIGLIRQPSREEYIDELRDV